MRTLLITQAKPNPSGKDRSGSFIPPTQLAGEWVDFKNTGNEPYPLKNIELQHVAYNALYPNGVWEKVTDFSGTLPVGQVVRVHSGGKIPLDQLLHIDLIGADHHIFSGKSYVWNNRQKDMPRLFDTVKRLELDKAIYDSYPPEGKVLKRVADKLI